MNMYGYVYLTTNLINGRLYVGQHKSSKFTQKYKGSGKVISQAFQKYGFDNFKVELLEEAETREELLHKEAEWINKLNAVDDPLYYNLVPGGQGFTRNGTIRITDGTRMKYIKPDQLSDYESTGWYKGTPKYFSCRVGLKRRGVPLKEETKSKMSAAHSGNKNHFYGKTFSAEVTAHLSQVRKGRIWITDGITDTQIDVSDFPKYESQGFYRGRSKSQGKDPEKWAERMSRSKSKCIWVHNTEHEHQVPESEFDDWISKGYTKGRLRRATTIENITSEKDTSEEVSRVELK